jgi:hypothetical protein
MQEAVIDTAIIDAMIYGTSNTREDDIDTQRYVQNKNRTRKRRRTNITKSSLIHAAKKSYSFEDMCVALGRDPDDTEYIFSQITEKAPGAEDFVYRNESSLLMKEYEADGDMNAMKVARADYIAAIARLSDNGLVHNPFKENKINDVAKSIKCLSSLNLSEEEFKNNSAKKSSENIFTLPEKEMTKKMCKKSHIKRTLKRSAVAPSATIPSPEDNKTFSEVPERLHEKSLNEGDNKSENKTFSEASSANERSNKTFSEAASVDRSPVNPFKVSSMYGLVFDVLYNNRETGIKLKDLVARVASLSGKTEKQCKFNVEVVKMARADGSGHKSIRHALPVYWVEKGDFGLKMHLR